MLCSAIGNAEKNGAERSPESVHQWELTGIQAPMNQYVQDMDYEIVRRPNGQMAHVAVEWDETMPPRIAAYFRETGCSALPIGVSEAWTQSQRDVAGSEEVSPSNGADNDYAEDAALTGVFDAALSAKYGAGSRTTALLVKQGDNVSERYREGFTAQTPQRTWSVAKSIAATLVGAAVQSGEFDVNDPVGMNYWRSGGGSDPRNALTIDHMLRMASGRYSDTPGNRTDALYWGGSSVNETATAWPMINPPGTVFRYANNDTLMAIKAVGTYVDYYGANSLVKDLGMTNTAIETDIRGDVVLSSQVWSTARDLAKLGQLYLDNGMVGEERIIPENWREYVSAASGPQPEGRGIGYGAGFWLFNQSESIPADTFAAMGNRGQYVVIVPSRNVVIVRRGEDPAGKRFDILAFTRDVLAALEE